MNYSELINILLEVIITIAVGFIIRLINTKIGSEKLNQILKWIEIAVKAAEDNIKKSNAGQEKKEIVTEFITNKFNNVDSEFLSTAIDCAVYNMNQEKKNKNL